MDGCPKKTMKCHKLKGSMARSGNQIKQKVRERGILIDVSVMPEGKGHAGQKLETKRTA